MRVKTHDGLQGEIIERRTNVAMVRFGNGKIKAYRTHQLMELDLPANRHKPPSRERDALIEKYQTMLDECRNDGARAVIVMILNDLK